MCGFPHTPQKWDFHKQISPLLQKNFKNWLLAKSHGQHLSSDTLLIWTRKNCQQIPPGTLNIFLILGNITDKSQNKDLSIDVFRTGGATILFSQNWNFELKFVLVNPFWEKMTYRWLRIHFLSKYGSKIPQNQTVLQQLLNKKML